MLLLSSNSGFTSMHRDVMRNVVFNDGVKDCASQAGLCWLATTDQNGGPSVSPKEVWHPNDDGTVVIVDIASAGSVRRILQHAAVCVSFIDIFRQKEFKLLGNACIVERESPEFGQFSRRASRLAVQRFFIRHLIVVFVKDIRPIFAPSYISRGSQRRKWRKTRLRLAASGLVHERHAAGWLDVSRAGLAGG